MSKSGLYATKYSNFQILTLKIELFWKMAFLSKYQNVTLTHEFSITFDML